MAGKWPPRAVIRGSAGLRAMEGALYRRGLGPVAGVDEAGRGACAGPLVVAACILGERPHKALAGLDDSKRLTATARERLYPLILRHAAASAIIAIPAAEVDALGVHVANLEGMRRAVAALPIAPGYVLTDGFRVQGLATASLSVIGGDANSACIAAASVLAKVARDTMMTELDAALPGYGFAGHKGYSTAVHTSALAELGPSVEHRFSYANVAAAAQSAGMALPSGRGRPARAR